MRTMRSQLFFAIQLGLELSMVEADRKAVRAELWSYEFQLEAERREREHVWVNLNKLGTDT